MSHGVKIFDVGDAVRCRAEFRDLAGTLIDPTTVSVSVKAPDGQITTKVYNTDPEVVRESAGKFYIDVDATASGVWHYRFFSTGTGKAAAERQFNVRRSNFA